MKLAEAFSLQLNDSTDVLKDAQFLIFVCFVDQNERVGILGYCENTIASGYLRIF